MSWLEATEPVCKTEASETDVELVIEARPRPVGTITVGRVLPARQRRMVGPFVFFDHMGPADFLPGQAIDVRPHPHIGLSTVTYLFEGEVFHRDSLGSAQGIRPGDLNWMTAGSGIVHSERTPEAQRAAGSRLDGIQLWVALPRSHEEADPEFHHHPAASLPQLEDAGLRLRVLVGSAYGAVSPVHTFSPMFYVEAFLPAGARLPLPRDYAERAVYVVEGDVRWGQQRFEPCRMVVFGKEAHGVLQAETPARLLLIGGDPLDEPRHIWWNFVSTSKDRIEQAKQDWKQGRFAKVPTDPVEFVPLPDF